MPSCKRVAARLTGANDDAGVGVAMLASLPDLGGLGEHPNRTMGVQGRGLWPPNMSDLSDQRYGPKCAATAPTGNGYQTFPKNFLIDDESNGSNYA